jgi:hypothetical protein
MSRWCWQRTKPDAKTAGKPKRGRASARADPRKTKNRHRDQPAPLTWNDPDQDFITRYGDPFDG